MYLEKAKKILEHEYKLYRVENINDFIIKLLDEKILHSYQVFGVGKYLLRHEEYFANYLKTEQDFLQAVVLLHDVARFYEFFALGHGEKIDHGVYGSEMIAKFPEFNKIEARLPIKHHGHLIEQLYEDEEYVQLPTEMQEKVKKITFLVRDADKIANFYLLAIKFNEMAPLFFSERCFERPYEKKISVEAWNEFLEYSTINLQHITNFSERALGFFSWIFDLNYQSSFEFMQKTNVVGRLIDKFSLYCKKKDLKVCKKVIEKFINQKFQ